MREALKPMSDVHRTDHRRHAGHGPGGHHRVRRGAHATASRSRRCAISRTKRRSACAACAWWKRAGACWRRPACARPKNGMVVSTNSDKVVRARRTLVELLMADHPSPCARQRQSNDCELETLARAGGHHAAAFPTPALAARPGRFVAGDRGGSRGVHPVRPLHSRLRRDPPQRRARAARQGLQGGHRVRSTTCRWATRPACRAASAWCRARPARSPTRAS